jgi:hypothetical protein
MLKVTIPGLESFNNKTNTFVYGPEQVLQLEHSLVSLSKWESKWHKPFLSKELKTVDETIYYIKCMTITQNVDFKTYNAIPKKIIDEISLYIEDPMTATTFSDLEKGRAVNRDIITSEIIYYWMVALNIPFECEKWHLNRLLTLINVCNIKNQPTKKMSATEILARNARINAARREKLKTNG